MVLFITMARAGRMVCAIALGLLAGHANGDTPSGLWAASEPVWPWQEAGRLWEIGAAKAGQAQNATAWPKTMGEICGEPVNPSLLEICRGKLRPRPASITLDAGAYPIGKRYPLGIPFETFSGDWY